ncbi:MAG: hypothetical protein WD771_06900 [Gemmatimonadaceae bacterium]
MHEPTPATPRANGVELAAVLAAGIGAAALGIFVLLHEAGSYSAPALYAPSGGLSGRTTGAVAVWLVAWVVLATRWRGRELGPTRILAWTLGLTAFALLATFPPLWALL